jgi:EpsI family protein
VLVVEQYLAVAMIPVAVWAVLGSAVTRALAFPLGFLLLGVPVGEVLIPPLIDFTAAFTVAGLRLSGVPVLQQGNFLTLANSHWSVVEACSGLRYLIACVTLGVLYAHLTYRSWWRRGLCLLASIIVPIIANGFRAYMIVMLGYLSDMTIAVGIDHLIYGWVFFGVVILLFFWVGSFFREDNVERPAPSRAAAPQSRGPIRGFLAAGALVAVTATVWPVWASVADSRTVARLTSWALPESVGEWVASSARTNWAPQFVGADFVAQQSYRRRERDEWVGVYTACYTAQTQGAELVNSSNVLAPDDSGWRELETTERAVALSRGRHDVVESQLDARGPKLLVWKWYWIDGTSTVSPYRAKLIELTGKLLAGPPLACGMIVYTPDSDAAAPRLTDFLNAAGPSIESGLASLRAD